MHFYKSYDSTETLYRISYDSFVNPFNYLSPEEERLLRSRHVKLPGYNPVIKRLNTPEIAGCSPKIVNY